MAGPLLQRIKRWLLGKNSGPTYYAQDVFAAASCDTDCQTAVDQIAKEALEKGEVITTTSVLRALCSQLPLEQAYGEEEAERFLHTLDAQLENPRMQSAPEEKALADHGVAMTVAMVTQSSRKEDSEITVARLAGSMLGQFFSTREILERGGFFPPSPVIRCGR